MKQALNQWLTERVQESELMDFQGLQLHAHHKGQEIVSLNIGKTYSYYDLASLTKIIFTTTYFMDAVALKKIKLFEPVQDILPWYPHKSIRVSDLLNHSAGNAWWQPYYKKINLELSLEQRYQSMERLCRMAKKSNSSQALYSDLDFFILGSIMQNLESKPLDSIWQSLYGKYFANTQLHFNKEHKPTYSRFKYAPTETCTWRKKTLRAEVHDENAWALGGVAPHAGLFGRVQDLSHYGLWLRDNFMGITESLPRRVLKKFTQRSLPRSQGDWGYGFMLPSAKNSSAGQSFSRRSFGHTGFTGVSLWYDPQRDLLVSLVSNRVHPSREQMGFVKLRPLLHDWIIEFIEDQS